jgi:dTDP-glucose pyrophosphorylase
MKDWRQIAVLPHASVRAVMQRMNIGPTQFALVVDADDRLLGTVSDGDIRRGLLGTANLEDPIETIMHRNPTTVREGADREEIISLLQSLELRHMPVLGEGRRVLALHTLSDLLKPIERDNLVVIMAGGRGERLRPLTESVPKPMLPVGGRPILEIILSQFARQGFCRFALSVNYRAEVIEQYFGDGSKFGVQVEYLREPSRLGTAGSLRLLRSAERRPMLVINGDILTKIDMGALLAFHSSHDAIATMCVREHEYVVPFGVVRTTGVDIEGFEEKPSVRWSINAGVYVLEPSAVASIPDGQYFDMPSLFESLRAREARCVAYAVRDYWLDVGRPDDFHRANADFALTKLERT